MEMLALLLGAIVGVSLGLTGGGGSLLAIPLLTGLLGVPPHDAVAVSLLTVGLIAAVGAMRALRNGEVEWPAALIFSAAGMATAPIGTRLGAQIPEAWLMAGFAALMTYVAIRMWRQAGARPSTSRTGTACAVQRDLRLHLTARCVAVLVAAGLATGMLSGVLGVGGGFIIVPAFVMVSGMSIRRAVATSLLVIALISVSGVTSFVWEGRIGLDLLTVSFAGGGIAGLYGGTAVGRRIPHTHLQRAFAAVIVCVAMGLLFGALHHQ